MRIPLYCRRERPNFGDRLSSVIIRHLTEHDRVYPGKPFAVGPVHDRAKEGDVGCEP